MMFCLQLSQQQHDPLSFNGSDMVIDKAEKSLLFLKKDSFSKKYGWNWLDCFGNPDDRNPFKMIFAFQTCLVLRTETLTGTKVFLKVFVFPQL